jgi:hypothetical protein
MSKSSHQKVFTTEKTHARKKRLRLIAELSVVALVIIGTGLTIFSLESFSYEKAFSRAKELLRLQRDEAPVSVGLTFEEKIRNEIDKKILNIASIEKTSEKNFKIKTAEKVTVFISTDKDLEFQSGTLQRLLSKAKIEKKRVSVVDFRFDKLVVRYK